MGRDACALQRRGARSVRDEQTWRLQTALGVAATLREHQSAGGLRTDNLIRPPILFGHRLGIQRVTWQDVARKQRIFAGSPGPSLYCAVIVKTVDAQTRAKTGINELLRE